MRGGVVNHPVLHPDRFDAQRYRFVNRSACFTRAPKDINQIDLFRNVTQRRIGPLAKHLCLVWVYRDDFVTAAAHVGSDAIRRTMRIGRESNDGDGLTVVQDFFDCFAAVDFQRVPPKKVLRTEDSVTNHSVLST